MKVIYLDDLKKLMDQCDSVETRHFLDGMKAGNKVEEMRHTASAATYHVILKQLMKLPVHAIKVESK